LTSPLTPPQTVGPFFHPCMLRADAPANVLVRPETAGERIRIEGRVLDGAGDVVPDALVEIWQANAHGRYRHPLDRGPAPLDPAFTGFGRCGTDEYGRFWFETVRPAAVPFDARSLQAPHILVTAFARGLLDHLVTRIYFPDEPANAGDAVLGRVPESRRPSLIAAQTGPGQYRFDVILQGARETPFLRV
jgi:protocatechuate 3,4-dioxygenase, alpha subunit